MDGSKFTFGCGGSTNGKFWEKNTPHTCMPWCCAVVAVVTLPPPTWMFPVLFQHQHNKQHNHIIKHVRHTSCSSSFLAFRVVLSLLVCSQPSHQYPSTDQSEQQAKNNPQIHSCEALLCCSWHKRLIIYSSLSTTNSNQPRIAIATTTREEEKRPWRKEDCQANTTNTNQVQQTTIIITTISQLFQRTPFLGFNTITHNKQ